MALTSFLVLLGITTPTPVETIPVAPIEIIQQSTSEESIPVVKVEKKQEKIIVQTVTPLPTNIIASENIVTEETPVTPQTVIIQIEEKKPAKVDNIFREQDYQMESTKTYSITPQEGSPLKPRTDISLEELRDYVIQTNYQIVSFRQKMAEATEEELIEYLEHNGFTVVVK